MIDRFVLVIGAMKAGTTTLFQLLRQHPRIAACREKEPNFLSEPERWRQGLAAYEQLWDWRPEQHTWALEASTSYTKLPMRRSASSATWTLPAEFRFVYLVRHPIARLRSEYLHSLAKGWLAKPIYEGLAPHSVLHSNYRMQLAPYIAAHGTQAVLVLSYGELCRDPLAVTRRVWGWLGLDASAPVRDPGPQNSSDGHRARWMDKCLERCNGDARAAAAEFERGIAPSPEQVRRIHELLDVDLALFRDQWGIDPWAETERSRSTSGSNSAVEALMG